MLVSQFGSFITTANVWNTTKWVLDTTGRSAGHASDVLRTWKIFWTGMAEAHDSEAETAMENSIYLSE